MFGSIFILCLHICAFYFCKLSVFIYAWKYRHFVFAPTPYVYSVFAAEPTPVTPLQVRS